MMPFISKDQFLDCYQHTFLNIQSVRFINLEFILVYILIKRILINDQLLQ